MSISLLKQADYRAMPWRNGLGTTTEIAIETGLADRFRWRLSIADVAQSGPFSAFDGYDRVIAVVAGAGMRLAVGGRPTVLIDRDSAPHAFPGDASTDCTLIKGPIKDFNLITDRASARGSVAVIRPRGKPLPVALDGGIALLHVVEGACAIDAGAAGGWQVPAGDTLRIDGFTGPVTIAGDGQALLATIRPR
jgi:uncharacterized protein